MRRTQKGKHGAVRGSIPFLAVTLALTVFLTSLVLESRDNRSHRANIHFGTSDTGPAGTQALLANSGLGPRLMSEPSRLAASLSSARADDLLAQAWSFYDSGNYQGALELVRVAARTDPVNPTVLEALGTVHFSLQDYPEAEAYLTRLLEAKPAMDDVSRMRLAVAQMRQRKYQPALQHLQAVADRAPGDGAVNFALACVFASLNRTEAALDCLDLAYAQLGFGLLAHISDPQLDSLRGSERFHAILRAARVGTTVADASSIRPQQGSLPQ